MSDLIAFIFHFNRGDFLRNTVASLKRGFPGPIVVIDDGSDDPLSKRVLVELQNEVEVIRTDSKEFREHWTGGLHHNMSLAMSIAAARSFEISLMIQDDMQMVRELTSKDVAALRAGFSLPNASFVIGASFSKTPQNKPTKNLAAKIERAPGIIRDRIPEDAPEDAFCSYGDTGFFSVPMFADQIGRLEIGEARNNSLLRERGVFLSSLKVPLMFFLPLPISHRGRKRYFEDKIRDWIAGAGVYPINFLEDSAINALNNRDVSLPAYAEEYLVVPGLPKVKYWSLRGGRSNLKCRGGWRRWLGEHI